MLKFKKNLIVNAIVMATSLTSLNVLANNNASVKDDIESISVISPKDNSIKISSSTLLKLPGTGNDPLKGLEALPGVVLATSNGGGPVAEPAVRGSSSKDNIYLTDSIDMGYVFHNDGLSIYNPLLIESFELQTGAWSSQYSNANGGVILTQLRDPNGDNPQNILDLSFFRSGFLIEQGITQNSAFYISFRESLVHTYVDNFIEDEEFSFKVPPRNRDYQSKFMWQLDDENTIRFLASGAKDYIEIEFDEGGRDIAKNPDLASGRKYQTQFHSQALSWQYEGQDISSNSSVNLLQQNQQDQDGDIFSWSADINKIIMKNDSVYFADAYTLNFGAQLSANEVDYQTSGRLLPCNTEFEMCPVSYFSPTFVENDVIKFKDYSLYAQVQSNLAADIEYQLGLTALGSDLNDEFYIEPRANLKWQINDENSVRLAYGLHHKWVDDYRLLTKELGNPDLNASRSNHFLVGFDNAINEDWQLRTEFYYKDFDNLIVANPDAQITQSNSSITEGITTYKDVASGTSYGVELLLNKKLTDNWFGWVSLAYSKTERENPLTQQEFNSEFDLPWVANLVLDYKINAQWQAGVKWRFQSGRRYTQVNNATPYYETGSEPLFYIPEYGDFNAEQVKSYHRLDARVDYQTQLMGLETNIYMEVLNLYGSRTIQEFEYNKDYSNYEKDYQFPDMPLPSIGITLSF